MSYLNAFGVNNDFGLTDSPRKPISAQTVFDNCPCLLFSVVNRQILADHLSALPSPMSSLLGSVIGGSSLLLVAWVYQLLIGREGMGGGDIKLLAMIGAFLGWLSVPLTLFSASLTGSLVGILLL